jgi:hypothetical protein
MVLGKQVPPATRASSPVLHHQACFIWVRAKQCLDLLRNLPDPACAFKLISRLLIPMLRASALMALNFSTILGGLGATSPEVGGRKPYMRNDCIILLLYDCLLTILNGWHRTHPYFCSQLFLFSTAMPNFASSGDEALFVCGLLDHHATGAVKRSKCIIAWK